MKFLTLTVCSLLAIFSAFAEIPDAAKADVWGHAPPASDDRFSNPKSKLYAGPDGWFNTGEVRATVSNAARTAYKYTGSFRLLSGDYVAVKDHLILHMEFGSAARPKAGVYQVGAKSNAAQNIVHFSFADVSDNQIKEWSAQEGAGTLTISLVDGFTYFTCRNVVLQPTGMSNKGEMKNPMTLGFEGALAPE
jgi:hypothetical protein